MSSFEVTEEYIVNKKKVLSVNVRPMKFAEYTRISSAALQGPRSAYDGALRRARMVAQVMLTLDTGEALPVTGLMLLTMPRKIGLMAGSLLSENIGEQGTILEEGDGINKPLLYKLGTPIGSATEKEITELEFMAKTYGDVEGILDAADTLSRTLAAFATIAKPVGMLAMPSWALDQIEIADGLFATDNIVTRFLE